MNSEAKSVIINSTTNSWHQMAAALPALLLCGVTFTILILDVLIPGMKDFQYFVYPILIKITGLAGLICAFICLMDDINRDRFRISVETALFTAFSVLMAISTMINGISKESIFGVAYRYVGVFDIYLCMIVYLYCSSRIESDRLKNIVLASMMMVADLIAAAFFYDRYLGSIASFRHKREPAAIFFHGNHYGYFLSVVIIVAAGCFLIHRNKKMIVTGALSLAINLMALVENRTMGAILAVGFVLFVMIIWTVVNNKTHAYRPWIFAVVIIAGLILSIIISTKLRYSLILTFIDITGVLSGNNDIYAGNGRWGIWQIIIDYIMDRPFFGFGCEGLKDTLFDYAFTGSPHNEPLTYAAFFGIPAAAVYITAVIYTVIKGIKNYSRNCICPIASFASLSYFMSSIFGLAMFYTMPFLFVMLGIGESAGLKDEL